MRRAFTIIGAAVFLIVASKPSFSDILSVGTATTYYFNGPTQPGDWVSFNASAPFDVEVSAPDPAAVPDFMTTVVEQGQYVVSTGISDSSFFLAGYDSQDGTTVQGQQYTPFFGNGDIINLASGLTEIVVNATAFEAFDCFNANCSFGMAPSIFVGVTFSNGLSYSLSAPVPEPSTWAMLLIGFAGIGFMTYRRRGNPTAA